LTGAARLYPHHTRTLLTVGPLPLLFSAVTVEWQHGGSRAYNTTRLAAVARIRQGVTYTAVRTARCHQK